ncbi:unnamed protein product [Effrenium voratum]|nr:unnamed protein product [Effrenium voratum]
MPLQLTSVCWASQTPAGCFKSNCRYLHVPISRRHRCWIQLWGFVWWHQRMFDDLASLVQCIRHVYVPEHQAAFQPPGKDDMDAQSEGAFRKMLETLRECCDLGLPLDFLNDKDSDSGYCLPPLPNQVKDVLATLTELVRALPLGHEPRVVVAGSMGLGADVGGSDLDVVLCCELEVDPQVALVAVRDALDQAEAQDVVLLDQVAVPLLSFRLGGLSVDMTLNQMSSIRDIVLFRYALRNAGPELPATLRLLKMWIKARRIPGTKQGGFPAVVWLRMAVRFYQESKTSAKRVARDWLRRFMARGPKRVGVAGFAHRRLAAAPVFSAPDLEIEAELPLGVVFPVALRPLTLHGEQDVVKTIGCSTCVLLGLQWGEYFSGRLASGVSPATWGSPVLVGSLPPAENVGLDFTRTL